MSNVVNLQKGKSVNLSKDCIVNLSKDLPKLQRVMVGLGWDMAEPKEVTREVKGLFGRTKKVTEVIGTDSIDCDAAAILLKDSRLKDERDVVYFGNLKHKTGAVQHMGDNLTGDGDGDDEVIKIDLDSVPKEYNKIVIAVNIYRADYKNQNFGMIENAFIRLVDTDNGSEICKFSDMGNSYEYSSSTSMIFGELYREGTDWQFRSIGDGNKAKSMTEIAKMYI